MGLVFSIYELDKIINKYDSLPIFSCCISLEVLKDKFKNYEHLNLGKLLSFELIKFNKEERHLKIEESLSEILSSVDNSKVLITNIDILFNPEYRLDVIKLFIQLSRNRKLTIEWPGEYSDGNLIYSEPGYYDYKKYRVIDYDIICLN